MNCTQILPLLSEHLDNELPPAQSGEVAGHLLSCASCGAEYDALKHASRMLRDLPLSPLPAGFMTRLHARRARSSTAGARVSSWAEVWLGPKPLAFAAAAFVFGLVLAGPWRSHRALHAPGGPIGAADSELPELKTKAPPPPALAGGAGGAGLDGALAPAAAPEPPAPPAAPASNAAPAPARMKGLSAARGAGVPFGQTAQPSNEDLYKNLQSQSDQLKIEAAPKEEPRRTQSFMGDRLGRPETRAQAEQSIRELAAMRRSFEESAGKAAQVPIAGTVAPVLKSKEAAGGAIDEGAPMTEGFWSGDYAAGNEGTRTVEKTEDWRALWRMLSTSAAPPLDFSRTTVLAIFLGARPTGGYSIELVETKRTARSLIVRWREHVPEPGMTPPDGATSPYALKAIPRVDVPVRFEKIR